MDLRQVPYTIVAVKQNYIDVHSVLSSHLDLNSVRYVNTKTIQHIREGMVLAFSACGLDVSGPEWFIDSRYTITDKQRELMKQLEPTLPKDKVTVFKVSAQDGSKPEKTTQECDTDHVLHGGVYFVGENFKRLCKALPSQIEKLFDTCLEFNDTELSYARYLYPVKILHSPSWDVSDPDALKQELRAFYPTYGLSIKIIRTSISIRESHVNILTDYPSLVIDSDFKPNGSASLMYHPSGDEDQYIHLWHTANRLNSAIYGHGSPKLMSTKSVDFSKPGTDMTTSCARHGIKIHTYVVGVHNFADADLSVWRTTLREVTKLNRVSDEQAKARLAQWCCKTENETYNKAVALGLTDHNLDINDYQALTEAYYHTEGK